MKWYWWLIIIVLIFIIWECYAFIKEANKYKKSQLDNGKECALTLGNSLKAGVLLNGVCVDKQYYINNTPNLNNTIGLPSGAMN